MTKDKLKNPYSVERTLAAMQKAVLAEVRMTAEAAAAEAAYRAVADAARGWFEDEEGTLPIVVRGAHEDGRGPFVLIEIPAGRLRNVPFRNRTTGARTRRDLEWHEDLLFRSYYEIDTRGAITFGRLEPVEVEFTPRPAKAAASKGKSKFEPGWDPYAMTVPAGGKRR